MNESRRTFIQSLLAPPVLVGLVPRIKAVPPPAPMGDTWALTAVPDNRMRGLMYAFTDEGVRVTGDLGEVLYDSATHGQLNVVPTHFISDMQRQIKKMLELPTRIVP